jgi:hypothetical protein
MTRTYSWHGARQHLHRPARSNGAAAEERAARDLARLHLAAGQEPDHQELLNRHINQSPPDQNNMSRPLYNRIWELTSRVEVKYMPGQSVSSFQMTEVIAGNKIRLLNLNGSSRTRSLNSPGTSTCTRGTYQR